MDSELSGRSRDGLLPKEIFSMTPSSFRARKNKTALTAFITGLLRIKQKVITMQIVHGYMNPYKHLHCIEREVKQVVGAHKSCILKWE